MVIENNSLLDWVSDGEKFALVGLQTTTDQLVSGQISSNLILLHDISFSLPSWWKEQIGKSKCDKLKKYNLFFLSKLRSDRHAVLDGENIDLYKIVLRHYYSLLLSCPFTPSYEPVFITGYVSGNEINIFQYDSLKKPVRQLLRDDHPIDLHAIKNAINIWKNLESIINNEKGNYWRLLRTINIYINARTNDNFLDRVYQYYRCIEGLILPDKREAKRQLKSRTEIFVGPRHHKLMNDIFEIRSAVVHMYESDYLEPFDRGKRLDALEKGAIAEFIARNSLVRIIESNSLSAHFANASTLKKFWELPVEEKEKLWGQPFDPLVATRNFDPDAISDDEIGGP